jgi:hypothetical protein
MYMELYHTCLQGFEIHGHSWVMSSMNWSDNTVGMHSWDNIVVKTGKKYFGQLIAVSC